MRIEWDAQLATNHPAIDDQHRELFALGQKVYDAIGDRSDKQALIYHLGELSTYAHSHFELEESLMRATDYPLIDMHTAAHDGLRLRASALLTAYKTGSDKIGVDLVLFLNEWLFRHIRELDRKMAEYVRVHRPSQSNIAIPSSVSPVRASVPATPATNEKKG